MPLSKPGLHCMSPTPSRDKHLESQEDEPRELRATPRLPKGRTEPDQQREWAGRSWMGGGGGTARFRQEGRDSQEDTAWQGREAKATEGLKSGSVT